MLRIIRSVGELNFYGLMQIYEESNQAHAREDYPGCDDGLLQVQMDVYAYLRDVFFRISGAKCCVWEENGRAVCALRLEPYQDGLLLTALETHPEFRRKGFAKKLITAVLETVNEPVYSHISRGNFASIAVHGQCGFVKRKDTAVLLDGTVTAKMDTYVKVGDQ